MIFRFDLTTNGSEWYHHHICGSSGFGRIDCENKWTQDWVFDLLKANNPKLQCLKKENYVRYKYFSVKFSDETEFKDEDTMKIIKKSLIDAKIKTFDGSIIERHVDVITGNTNLKEYFYLLEDRVVNALAKKEYTIPAGTARLTFKIIEPRTKRGCDCPRLRFWHFMTTYLSAPHNSKIKTDGKAKYIPKYALKW